MSLELSASEYNQLIAKHGKITYKAICELKGIKPEKAPKSFKKPHSTKNLEEIKLLLRLAGYKYELEYRFDKVRKFRFDIAFPEKMLAIEYEGIFSEKSRHTNVKGFSTDCTKYNLAASKGWTVLRYTAKNFTNVVSDVENFLKN